MARQGEGRAVPGRWSEEQARAVLRAWDESGRSGASYARSIGVVAQRLFWWRRRLGRANQVGRLAHQTREFVPVVVHAAAPAAVCAILVTTPRGAQLEVRTVDAATAGWVAAVILALDESRS